MRSFFSFQKSPLHLFLIFAAVALLCGTLSLIPLVRASNNNENNENDPAVALDGIIEFTTSSFDAQVGKSLPAFVEFYAPWCGHCKNLVPEFAKLGQAALSVKDKIIIGKVDATRHGDLASRLGVSGYPTLLFFPPGSLTPVKYTQQRSVGDFVNFLNAQVPQLQLVAPASSNANTNNNLHKYTVALNAQNYDNIVMNPTKDAFVMYFAPWCGHCKRLHPVWDELARAFQNEPDVIIASLNADDSTNSAMLGDRIKINGFPTLAFLPKNGKSEPIYYDGGRDINSLVGYVNKHTGKQRRSNGDLESSVGVNTELTQIVHRLISSDNSKEKQQEILKEVKETAAAAANNNDDSSKHYTRIAEKIIESGAEYVERELKRLTRVLEGSVSGPKRDIMNIRANILTSIRDAK